MHLDQQILGPKELAPLSHFDMSFRSEHSLENYEFTFEKYLTDSNGIEADVRLEIWVCDTGAVFVSIITGLTQ